LKTRAAVPPAPAVGYAPNQTVRNETPASMRPVYAEAERAALIGLVANALLAAVKLAAGLIGQSFALIADAINSLGDVVTSTVVLGALHYAQRPADREHPYGHARIEAAAGAGVSILILSSAGAIAWEAVQRLGSSHLPPPAWTFWVAGGTVVLKESLYRYKAGVAKKAGSRAILANAWDHRSDALAAMAVLIGLAAGRFGGDRFRDADEIAALVVVGFILLSGLRLLKGTIHELMDAQADSGYVERVRSVAESVERVQGVEKLFIRKTGLEYLVDIHIEVEPELTVREGHRVGHHVRDRLLGEFTEIREVLVHLEPAGPK
jgi:cation diffusion facilitator family transporter